MIKPNYMQEAIDEARLGVSGGHGGPFGSIIVLDGSIIGRGHNRVVSDLDPTQHGEIVAIRDAYKHISVSGRHLSEIGVFRPLEGSVLYTTCYPCPMCVGACLWSGITKIYYGCTSRDAENLGFDDKMFYDYYSLNEKANELLMQDTANYMECKKLFDDYHGMRY